MTWYYGKCKSDLTQYGFYLSANDCTNPVTVTDERYEELMEGCDCTHTIAPDENGNPVLVTSTVPVPTPKYTGDRVIISNNSGLDTVSSAVTKTELERLSGITSGVQTQLNGKQATITGGATSIASSDLTASRTLISDSNGKVAVSNVTSAELGYLNGVTSAIQTQIDAKQDAITGGATSIISNNLSTSKALISDSSGKVAVSDVTATELGYLDGVTSGVQTQLNGKQTSALDTSVSASPSNARYPSTKLMSDFVNSSVATNTANYISNAGEPFTSLAQLEAYTGTVTNNDYAFITGTDTSGNTYYDRYKATVSGSTVTWAKEYRLNNSSFTSAQWSAISSGIDATAKGNYDAHLNNTSNPHSVTKSQIGLGSVANTGDSATPISGGTTKFTTGGAYTQLNKKVDKTTTVNGHALSADVTVTKSDVGLGNVDNTSDANKPISTAVQNALDSKQPSGDYVLQSALNTLIRRPRYESAWNTTRGVLEIGSVAIVWDSVSQSSQRQDVSFNYEFDNTPVVVLTGWANADKNNPMYLVSVNKYGFTKNTSSDFTGFSYIAIGGRKGY